MNESQVFEVEIASIETSIQNPSISVLKLPSTFSPEDAPLELFLPLSTMRQIYLSS
jgi:hypothetical protein